MEIALVLKPPWTLICPSMAVATRYARPEHVALGGGLTSSGCGQDHFPTLERRTKTPEPAYHHIYISPGSKLAAVVGSGGFVRVNSRHRVGNARGSEVSPYLLASAYSLEDGLIEAAGEREPQVGDCRAVQSAAKDGEPAAFRPPLPVPRRTRRRTSGRHRLITFAGKPATTHHSTDPILPIPVSCKS